MPLEWDKLLCNKRMRDIVARQSSDSGEYSSHGWTDRRSEFDRDYDRAIFSSPVRRLQDKAQVFPLERNDFIRTRLTHSLEVSAVARGLAIQAFTRLLEDNRNRHPLVPSKTQVQHIKRIASTCGLLHDLGNPPFGHAGEEAIRGWFSIKGSEEKDLKSAEKAKQIVESDNHRKTLTNDSRAPKRLIAELEEERPQLAADFMKFDGNAQTIRLVAHLQMLKDKLGLNLTAATLTSLQKYTYPSHEVDGDSDIHEATKPGFLYSEQEIVDEARDVTGLGRKRHPISFLVEAADDAVYSAVDLEDARSKGLLSYNGLKKAVSSAIESVTSDRQTSGSEYTSFDALLGRTDQYMNDADIVKNTGFQDDACTQYLRVKLIEANVRAATKEFVQNYERIMAGEYHDELLEEGDTAHIVSGLKKAGRKHAYQSPGVLKNEVKGRRIIEDLMNVFWEGVRSAPYPTRGEKKEHPFARRVYSLMSENYRVLFEDELEEKTKAEELHRRFLLLTDFISGMTDSYAADLHRQLHYG